MFESHFGKCIINMIVEEATTYSLFVIFGNGLNTIFSNIIQLALALAFNV